MTFFAGCTESIVSSFGPNGSLGDWLPLPNKDKWLLYGYSCVLNSISLTVCLIGARLFGRTTTVVLAMVLVSGVIAIASFFQDLTVVENFTIESCTNAGDKVHLSKCAADINVTFHGILTRKWFWSENLLMDFAQDCSDASMPVTFSVVFGVLFSSVTGIMAGANLSGELNDPGGSISKGTLSALGFTLFVYVIMVLGTATTFERKFLLNDCYYLNKTSLLPESITMASLLLTFSASLANLLGVSKL